MLRQTFLLLDNTKRGVGHRSNLLGCLVEQTARPWCPRSQSTSESHSLADSSGSWSEPRSPSAQHRWFDPNTQTLSNKKFRWFDLCTVESDAHLIISCPVWRERCCGSFIQTRQGMEIVGGILADKRHLRIRSGSGEKSLSWQICDSFLKYLRAFLYFYLQAVERRETRYVTKLQRRRILAALKSMAGTLNL